MQRPLGPDKELNLHPIIDHLTPPNDMSCDRHDSSPIHPATSDLDLDFNFVLDGGWASRFKRLPGSTSPGCMTAGASLAKWSRRSGLNGGWGHFIGLSTLQRYDLWRVHPAPAPALLDHPHHPQAHAVAVAIAQAAVTPLSTPPASPPGSVPDADVCADEDRWEIVLDHFVSAGAVWDAYMGRIVAHPRSWSHRSHSLSTLPDSPVIIKICKPSSYRYRMRTFEPASDMWQYTDKQGEDDSTPQPNKQDDGRMLRCLDEVLNETTFYTHTKLGSSINHHLPAFYGTFLCQERSAEDEDETLVVEVLEACESMSFDELRRRRAEIFRLYRRLHESGYTHGDVSSRHIVGSASTLSLKLIDFGRSERITRHSAKEEMELVRRVFGTV